jgi:hypothetical protein
MMSVNYVNGRRAGFDRVREFSLKARPVLYISLIIFVAIGAFGYNLRTHGIFACSSSRYSADTYLAYCSAAGYGDYEHAAFWFDLEPGINDFAKAADVLFLGNSRVQMGFSTAAAAEAISALNARYYLLGFTWENHIFEEKLLNKLDPQARVYVINLDTFFAQSPSLPTKALMTDPDARTDNARKHRWQIIHNPLCRMLSAACGDEFVVFRSRNTGVWQWDWPHGSAKPATYAKPVTYDESIDRNVVDQETVAGQDFLLRLPVRRECVIPTLVPTPGTRIEQAGAIARALKIVLVAPKVEGLATFDGSHLDRPSAERWSRAFFQEAGARIRKCLDYPLQTSN